MLKMRDEILKSIDILVEERVKRLKFNYMVEGLITEVINEDTYEVNIQEIQTIVKSANKNTYQIGDVVYIIVWNNDYSNQTIICKATR